MKKALLILMVSVFVSGLVFAQDWDDFAGLDKAWDGQKSVTNKEFEEVMDVLESKKKKVEEKKKKKLFKRVMGGGESLHTDMEHTREIPTQKELTKNEDGQLLNLPVSIVIDNSPLERGFYKVFAEKDKNGDIYFSFYQSQFFKGKIRATETDDDYGQETIDFVEMLPYDNSFVKIIFGSLDFNAYAYVRYQ